MSLLHRDEPRRSKTMRPRSKGIGSADTSASMGHRIRTILAYPEAQTSQATAKQERPSGHLVNF
jgi:hypothetical protein